MTSRDDSRPASVVVVGGGITGLAAAHALTRASGERVCVTVLVNRAGKLGPPSAEKCVDVPEGSG